MNIDISNLSPEKQALLKACPDLLHSLEQAIPRQVQKIQKRSKTKSKFQRDLEDVDRRVVEARRTANKLRQKYIIDSNLRKIEDNLKAISVTGSKLICPQCSDRDRGNKLNKKPWCLKCNVPLVEVAKVLKWMNRTVRVVDDKFGVK